MSDSGEAMQARTREIERMAAEARGEAVSENGEVRIVAKAGGRIEELDLRLSAFELSGVELGELIVSTLRTAEDQLDAQLTSAIQAAMGSLGAFTEEEGSR
ncbi:YbaB/EbfC family nucleoid-associated protein [Glycomyces niveus]|jgi:DNA-binding protein YbaB|uniref:YbaB/EbfC family nucleoid-associated protein n=1 Tax=Glycomyces niveus TaxID=2820287 RepID=A0ABS3UCV4_9ACTN|nr:YbaB/EbfC family nucleoid-associated protein [Glycomyces sp. NEAU-S30]MBO3735588.1 YbaB/EbfC family nucleoid-associated protein [Glycomyces sp. NEAU-S30]